MRVQPAIILILLFQVLRNLDACLQPCLHKPPQTRQPIEGIDYIYLINLDHNRDRLQQSLQQLAAYHIAPYRFPAIYGKNLSSKTIRDVAVIYTNDFEENQWALTVEENGEWEYQFLNTQTNGLPIYSRWMTSGHVGCALSHLSILQDAYNSGYDTIWVLEDDFKILHNPHQLSEYIKKLDALTQGQWDILYTDASELNDKTFIHDIAWWMWRPDQHLYNIHLFSQRQQMTDDFIKVGAHLRTHSMIIRRSGMEKILNHFNNHHFYLPIDHEIAFAPNIQLYVMATTWVTYQNNPSDTRPATTTPSVIFGTNRWDTYKKNKIALLNKFNGWCTPERANKLMDFIHTHQPKLCVEIGTYGGSTTFPLIAALKYLHTGKLFTIDSWNNQDAISGLAENDPNYAWWQRLDLSSIYQQFVTTLNERKLNQTCTVLPMSSQHAAAQFADESIDFLYIDGNFSSSGSLDDVMRYFSKVKRGGYIWLHDADSPNKLSSVTYLMQHAIWLKKESLRNESIVFQKPSA